MDSIRNDLSKPLPNVERAWIRRPTILLLCPIVFLIVMVFAPFEETAKFIRDCW